MSGRPIKNLIFLYSANGPPEGEDFRSGPVRGGWGLEFVKTDSYVFLLQQLLSANLVERVSVVVKTRSDSDRFVGYGTHQLTERMELVFPPSIDSVWGYLPALGKEDAIWTRGVNSEWTRAIRANPQCKKIAYALAFINSDIDEYDLIFADDHCNDPNVLRHPNRARFIKCCNEEIFALSDEQKEFDFISVGTFRARKGQLRVIKAAARMKPEVRLCFPGAVRDVNYLRSCQRAVASAGLTALFPGNVTRGELNSLYNRSRVNVLASINEQAPRCVLEAACCDVPSVVTRNMGGGLNYVTREIGTIRWRWRLKHGMERALTDRHLSPRRAYLENFSIKHSVQSVMEGFKKKGWL